MPYQQFMLTQTIIELDTFIESLMGRCGDPTLMGHDTDLFLASVNQNRTANDIVEEHRLRNRRMIFTQWCTDAQIATATAAARGSHG